MYFKITKGELTLFLKSFVGNPDGHLKWNRLEGSNIELFNSLNDLGSILNTYYLHSKPSDYILNEWEFSDLMYQSKTAIDAKIGQKKFVDLITYFDKHIRNEKIELIIDGFKLDKRGS